MATVSSNSRNQKSNRNRVGTLGVDIGSSAIKMVRMEWASGRWTIKNRLMFTVEEPSADMADDLASGFLGRQLDSLSRRTLSTPHDCACVLPMSVTEFRSIEVPAGNENDINLMAQEALRDCFPHDFEERVTRLWRHVHSPHDLTQVSGISVKTAVGEGIVEDLNRVGFDCRSMASIPFALTQAASMSPVGRSQQPIGLLSWENSTATFVVTHNGRPEFIRTLRDCSGKAVNERIVDGLGVKPDEARSLLASIGLTNSDDTNLSPLTKMIEPYVQPEVQKICSELNKTTMYLRHHLPKLLPARLVLFGGMATVPDIARSIQESCGMETSPWSLNADNSHATDPIFAPAIAASAGITLS